jgi:molecular chaperone DnaK
MRSRQKIEALSQASHKLAEVMYQQAAQDGQRRQLVPVLMQVLAPEDDDVVDADFEEVKKDK